MQVKTTKICNFLKKISIFSALLACSAAAFCASDKKWTLAAEQFEFTQNTNNSKAAVSYAKTMPSLILEQMAENLTRIPRAREQLDRALYDLQKERLSLFLQLSKEVKTRDSLLLADYSARKLKAKLKESDVKIRDIEKKIDENLQSALKETSRREKRMQQDEMRIAHLEQGEIVDDRREEGNGFSRFFKGLGGRQDEDFVLEDVVLYKNDFNQLFDAGEEQRKSGYDSYYFGKACVDAGIQGLITGKITVYGNYISISTELYQYPGGRRIASVSDVGITDDLRTLVTSIAAQLTPKIADSMPVELFIEVFPPEAAENIVLSVNDVVYSDGTEKITLPSGVHTITFSSKGYITESTSYSFTGNRRFKITVEMQPDNPGELFLAMKKPFSGDLFANGLFSASLSPSGRFASIHINNQQILGHFVSENGEPCDFLIRSKYLSDGNFLLLDAKPFDRSSYIEKRRIWMYRSYSLLIVSLLPTFYCYGNSFAASSAYNDGYGVSYDEAKKWETARNVTAGISIGCGVLFVVELVRYLRAANSVLPAEAKKMSTKELTKIRAREQIERVKQQELLLEADSAFSDEAENSDGAELSEPEGTGGMPVIKGEIQELQ